MEDDAEEIKPFTKRNKKGTALDTVRFHGTDTEMDESDQPKVNTLQPVIATAPAGVRNESPLQAALREMRENAATQEAAREEMQKDINLKITDSLGKINDMEAAITQTVQQVKNMDVRMTSMQTSIAELTTMLGGLNTLIRSGAVTPTGSAPPQATTTQPLATGTGGC